MKTIKLFFSNAIHAIKGIFSNLKDWKLILVLTIPTIAAIYFASTVAISCDESVTFFNYAKRPLEKCMVRYPEPGNHILNSILIWFSNRLPITDILYKIRLPSVIFSFFTWLVAYSFIKKNWGGEKRFVCCCHISDTFHVCILQLYGQRICPVNFDVHH